MINNIQTKGAKKMKRIGDATACVVAQCNVLMHGKETLSFRDVCRKNIEIGTNPYPVTESSHTFLIHLK